MKAQLRVRAKTRITFYILYALALQVAADTSGQQPDLEGKVTSGTLPPWMTDDKGRPIAHLHNSDMSCCAPCAPETNQDADVFKRPCFVRALAHSRKGFDAYLGLTEAEEVRLPQDAIPLDNLQRFETLLTALLQPAFLPARWNKANFHVPYPLKSVMEVRGGATTFVGHTVDRSTVAAGDTIDAGDPIQGAWAISGIEVLPRTPNAPDRPKSAVIRLRLRGDERLEIRSRPEDFSAPGARQKFFDPATLHDLLTKVLRVPFETPVDWFTDGYDATYDGVRVFVGAIVARERGRVWVGGENPPQHWWQQMRLLVTDSDPQYFCVSIVLGRDDVIPAPQP